MMINRLLSIILVFLTLLACNSKQVITTEFPAKTPNPSLEPPSPIFPSQTVIVEPTRISTYIPPPLIVEVPLDPCVLVSQSSVEAILNEAVSINPRTNACVYGNPSASHAVGIHVITAEDAKLEILKKISKLHSGCVVELVGTYDNKQPENPTPLPIEIQVLGNQTIVELMSLYFESVLDCGLTSDNSQTIDGLGNYAYFFSLDIGFLNVGTISVALEDFHLEVILVNNELNPDEMLEACLTLTHEALKGLR